MSDDTAEGLVVVSDDDEAFFHCQAPKGPNHGPVGFTPITCEVWEAPGPRVMSEADRLYKQWQERMARSSSG